jgi:hypothetical protein
MNCWEGKMMGEMFFSEAQSYSAGEVEEFRHIIDRERLLCVFLTQPVSDINGRMIIWAGCQRERL